MRFLLMTDLSAIFAKAGVTPPTPKAEPQFVLPANKFLVAKKALKRPGIKRFIKPENARTVITNLPSPGDHTHCLLKGDFILGDLIPLMLTGQHCTHLRIATLGLSVHNAETLANLRETSMVDQITLLTSLYFREVNKDETFKTVMERLAGHAKLVVARSHVKIILIPTATANWVMESSANLRSSDNLELMTIFNDKEIHDWHAAWIDEMAAREEHE